MSPSGSFYGGRNVLVAGGCGLIGQNLTRRLLEEGACVRATRYRKRGMDLQHKNLEVLSCDLLTEEGRQAAFRDMEIAFIAAAHVGSAKVVAEGPSELILYNLQLQSSLIHWAAKMRLMRCGFVSSTYVYPDTQEPSREEEGFQGDPPAPTIYGLGWFKRYLETLCKHFQMTSDTDFAIVRPSTIYGPFDHFSLEEGHAIPALVVKAVNRMDPLEVWGSGMDVRSYLYVDDLVEGFLRAVEKYSVGEPLNLAGPRPATIRDVVRMILDALGFQPKVVFSAERPSTVSYKVSDASRARELLRWQPRVGLEEGLRRTVDWYLQQQPAAAPKMEVPDLL